MFNNLRELIATMPDETTCRNYLIRQRWNGNVVCPYCGFSKVYVIENGKRFKCGDRANCAKKFSVTVGTIMEASNIPVHKWLTAIYICTADKKGISSYQLAKDIGISQKASWFMIHRIRERMMPKIGKKFSDFVEADLTFVGGSIENKTKKIRKLYAEGKLPSNKTSVLGIAEREGSIVMQVVPKNQDKFADSVIRENVEFAANIVTDEGNEFTRLKDEYFHYTVNHSQNEYARLEFHTNSIEGVFSHFKRMVYGIYHQISQKHTQRYLNEFAYRFNSRNIKDCARFEMTVKNIEGRLTYKQLVATKEPIQSMPKSSKKPKTKPVIQRKGDEVIGQYNSIAEASRA